MTTNGILVQEFFEGARKRKYCYQSTYNHKRDSQFAAKVTCSKCTQPNKGEQNSSWSLKNIERDMANKKLDDGQMSINII